MNSGHAQQIVEYLRRQRRPMLKLLKALVEAESPSSRPDCHRRIRAILATELDRLCFKIVQVRGIDSGRHIYARPASKSTGRAAQLLVGHFDTVWPVGTVADRPFTISGNTARGPGIFDMKGGLVQMLYALRTLQALDLHPVLLPVVFLNSDEEIGSRNSVRFIRALARRVERVLVLEPAMGKEGKIKTERKGVGRFTITVYGKAAHAGLDPESGASAILELSHVIQALFALNDSDKGINVNVGTVDGGMRPNVVAPFSQAIVDVRVPTQCAAHRIEDSIYAIRPATAGVRLEIAGRIGRPSMGSTPRNLALWHCAHELGQALGIDLQQGRAGGASDGNTTSQFTATLDGLGAVGDGAHAEHEFLYIDKMLERTALLVMLLLTPSLKPRTSEAQS